VLLVDKDKLLRYLKNKIDEMRSDANLPENKNLLGEIYAVEFALIDVRQKVNSGEFD
jgi:hypothetical protein